MDTGEKRASSRARLLERTGSGRGLAPAAAVFALAFAVRLWFAFREGGVLGNHGYDPSVYYAAADAFVHGRLPYRDFVLVHPPGVMLVQSPFALIGRLTSDSIGFFAVNIASMLMSGVNAVLVMQVATRLNMGRQAALFGGLFYALWMPSVAAEYVSRLEPLGNFLALLGLLAYAGSQHSSKSSLPFLCGMALGGAASVKIWWVVPLAIVVIWHLVPKRSRPGAVPIAAGAASSLFLINGFFFLAAPSQMWHMVVADQLGRSATRSTLTRFTDMLSLGRLVPGPPRLLGLAVVSVIGAAYLLACAKAWGVRAARLVTVLGIAQIAVLLAAPSWFFFYADYAVPAIALTLAAAVSRARAPVAEGERWTRRGSTALPPVSLALVAVTTVIVCGVRPGFSAPAFPARQFSRAVAHSPCVMSDSPLVLIRLDVLSRGFAHGCANWVDVAGKAFGVEDAPASFFVNRKWQSDLLDYLESGDVIIVFRQYATGISRTTLRAIRRGGILAAGHGYVVFRSYRARP